MQNQPIIWRNQMLSTNITGSATLEPVTVAFAKSYLKILYSEDDDTVTQMISAARLILEKAFGTSLVAKSYSANFMFGGRGPIRLNYGPVTGITAVTYKDCLCPGVAYATLDAAKYGITGDQFQGTGPGYYQVTYRAGYDTLPADLQIEILKQVAWMYENRGDESQVQLNPSVRITGSVQTKNMWI